RLALPVLAGGGLLSGAVLVAREPTPARVGLATFEAALGAAFPALAWWLYRRLGTRGRNASQHPTRGPDLAEPRCATFFLVLVPGLAALLAGLAQVGLAWLTTGPAPTLLDLARAWLAYALGVLVLAPPLLVLFRLSRQDSPLAPGPWLLAPQGQRRGDRIEVAGLALGAAVLGLLLPGSTTPGTFGWSWPPWGLLLLLVVWASLRQALPGGTVVAGCAAAGALWGLRLHPKAELASLVLLQGHLAAGCATALLVAAAASWTRARETACQRIVARVPVVIYSARFCVPPEAESGRGPRPLPHTGQGIAEVTLVSAASAALLSPKPEELLGDYSRWLACVHEGDREVVLA